MEMIMIEKNEYKNLISLIKDINSKLDKLTTEEDNKLYNVTEAARELNITPQTLHAYIRAGYVTPLKINGSNKFTKEIIEQLKK